MRDESEQGQPPDIEAEQDASPWLPRDVAKLIDRRLHRGWPETRQAGRLNLTVPRKADGKTTWSDEAFGFECLWRGNPNTNLPNRLVVWCDASWNGDIPKGQTRMVGGGAVVCSEQGEHLAIATMRLTEVGSGVEERSVAELVCQLLPDRCDVVLLCDTALVIGRENVSIRRVKSHASFIENILSDGLARIGGRAGKLSLGWKRAVKVAKDMPRHWERICFLFGAAQDLPDRHPPCWLGHRLGLAVYPIAGERIPVLFQRKLKPARIAQMTNGELCQAVAIMVPSKKGRFLLTVKVATCPEWNMSDPAAMAIAEVPAGWRTTPEMARELAGVVCQELLTESLFRFVPATAEVRKRQEEINSYPNPFFRPHFHDRAEDGQQSLLDIDRAPQSLTECDLMQQRLVARRQDMRARQSAADKQITALMRKVSKNDEGQEVIIAAIAEQRRELSAIGQADNDDVVRSKTLKKQREVLLERQRLLGAGTKLEITDGEMLATGWTPAPSVSLP